MSGKKGHGGGGGGGGHDAGGGLRWLLTYADMITLLLALFIYLYSVSEVNEAKMAAFTAAFSEAFGIGSIPVKEGSPGANPTQGFQRGLSRPRLKQPPSGEGRLAGYKAPEKKPGTDEARRDLEKLKKQLEQQFPDWLKTGSLTLLELSEGLMLRLRDNALFEKGRAELTANAQEILGLLASRLSTLDYPLRIEGHTDDLPLAKNALFQDNWELSGARAASVVRYFIEHQISGGRMSLAGYGEYRPIEPNVPGQGNPINRRVEILIVAPFSVPGGGEEETTAQEAAPAETTPEPSPETSAPQTPPLVFSEPEVVPAPDAEAAPPAAPTPPAPRAQAP